MTSQQGEYSLLQITTRGVYLTSYANRSRDTLHECTCITLLQHAPFLNIALEHYTKYVCYYNYYMYD